MESSEKTPAEKVSPWLIVLTLACIAGAAYAFFNEQCDTCKGARERLHGFNLALAGLIFYALMLLLCALKKRSLLTWGYGFAAGIHLCLVTVLLMYWSETGGICPPCLFTAACAFLATALLFPRQARNALAQALLIAIVFVVSGTGLYTLDRVAEQQWKAAYDAAQSALKDSITREVAAHPIAPGRIKMILFTRRDCHHCAEFKQNVLPKIVAEFKDKLDVDERDVPNDYTASPTVIVCTGKNAVFVDDPILELVRAALQSAEKQIAASH